MMHDPFSGLESGLNGRLADLVGQLALPRRPTLEHVHALLAYHRNEGVKDKFDARFGQGSADAIIAASERQDLVLGLRGAVDALTTEVARLAAKVEAQRPPDFSEISAQMSRLPAEITAAIPAPAAPDQTPVLTALSGMTAALATLQREMAEMRRLAAAEREVITDHNNNVIGVRIKG